MVRSRDPNIIYTLVGELPKAQPELGADIIGMPGATGIAEGPARLVITGEDLDKVKTGDILIAPTTGISWTTVFALVKGAVLDRGGALSHAAIACREYGIPCILNTFVGTSQIKDGQRIRIDGARGAVYILDKS
jgi:pyruvate,water dikinase